MELRQLRYFVTLAEEPHFGRAAGREHIVRSALSQQLQRLERKLGILLLDPTTHHVQLTPAGRAFLVEAGVPEQVRRLTSDRLDVGTGWASLAPPEVASELFRLDPLGVLVPEGHRLAASQEVPVSKLAASRGSCAGVVGAA
jgi:DNA-binding transcriptional LysR family regulator